MPRVIVIGAGVGGLTTAAVLARAGLDVTVLEAQVYPGGCASTYFHQGYRFDAVIVESVLGFVDDKPRAIRECIRVTRSGGYMGLNESLWMKDPSPEMIAMVKDSIGSSSVSPTKTVLLIKGSVGLPEHGFLKKTITMNCILLRS